MQKELIVFAGAMNRPVTRNGLGTEIAETGLEEAVMTAKSDGTVATGPATTMGPEGDTVRGVLNCLLYI